MRSRRERTANVKRLSRARLRRCTRYSPIPSSLPTRRRRGRALCPTLDRQTRPRADSGCASGAASRSAAPLLQAHPRPWDLARSAAGLGAGVPQATRDPPFRSVARVQQLRALTFNYAAAAGSFSSQLVLRDALEILNLSWNYNATAFSKPIVGAGPERMSMVDVLDLASTYVSTAELVARTGCGPLKISNILKSTGLVQPFPGCWIRSSAEEALRNRPLW